MRAAISAYACSENRGSEHELGWKCLKENASEAEEVHFFTNRSSNPGIEAQLETSGLNNVTLHLIDFTPRVEKLLKSMPYAGYQVAAYFWEFRLFFYMWSQGFCKQEAFDLGVKSTYGSYRWPSFLWFFCRKFRVDPLSGGGGFPLRFRSFFSLKAQRKELFRKLMQRVSLLDPFVLLTLWKADELRAGNDATRVILPAFARKKCIVKRDFLTVSAEDFLVEEARAMVSIDPELLKIFHTAKLLEWKGVMVILRALAQLPEDVRYEFNIMGNGPARTIYDDYIQEHSLNVNFIDPRQVPRPDLSFYYLSHDLFVFPTLHGESGFAPVEAKLHGMRLLTLDFSGLDQNLTEGDICIETIGKNTDAVVGSVAQSLANLYYDLKQTSL